MADTQTRILMLIAVVGVVIVTIWTLNLMKPYGPGVPTVINLKGYNFARDLAQLSLTVANEHTGPLVVKSISLNGTELRLEGLSDSKLFRGSEIVFAPYGGWRCPYILSSQCVVPPRGITTLYIGVAWEPGSVYNIALITDKGVFTFELKAAGAPMPKH
ncbi:MAG: hypothetical protein QW756_00575 [Nitrososphaerota archaeon]